MAVSSMIEALLATGPHPELADKLALFGQFVGAWDMYITNIGPDGSTAEVAGEWHFGWALEGRAVIDVWIAPRRELRDGSENGGYGVTVRCFEPASNAWRSTWIGPGLLQSQVVPFIGRAIDGEIVLEANSEEGHIERWIFSDVTHTRFNWRSIESTDGGTTWLERQHMVGRRAK